jgi:hypothetical protein
MRRRRMGSRIIISEFVISWGFLKKERRMVDKED